MSSSAQTLIDEGLAALRVGDGAAAREAFDAARATNPGGEVLEGLARSAYVERDYARSIECWNEAYKAFRDERDPKGAIRMARTLAYMYGSVVGDTAVMSGWSARATSLLADGEDSVERGWLAMNRGMFEGDARVREQRFREALEVARAFGDASLEFATLAYLGATLVSDDRTDEGMLLLDEALAAVAGNEVDDVIILQEIFCQLFSACEHAHDVDRADQWIRVGEELAARRNLPAASAHCRTHYGGLLTGAGRWDEADVELTDAVRLWELGHTALRRGALVRLADLRVRQGRLEEAEQFLDGLDLDNDAARPWAALHLSRGNTELAVDVIQRAVHAMDPACIAAAPLWSLLVEVHLAAGQIDEAAAAVEQLDQCAARHPSHYVGAMAALAHGRLCRATPSGDGDPCACLREAMTGFAKSHAPLELAQTRLELAHALATTNPTLAVVEARAALDGFEQLPADRQADAAAALLRSLGAHDRSARKEAGLLTKREAEVLELLSHGLSNPEIAERLYISRKTAEHHVGRILAKLNLRSRAEAAAYATKGKPAER